MLSVQNVSVWRGDRQVLHQVTLAVRPGELVALVGPNGAGKSSLLLTISGDISSQEGEIQWNGRTMKAWPVEQLACQRGVLPQFSPLNFPLTVQEVVQLGRHPHVKASTRQQDEAAVAAALEVAGIAPLAERSYLNLSGGERQRTQFARVWAQLVVPEPAAPRLLLLDEPVASLDVQHQHHILAASRTLADVGACVLVVLHDLNLAARYADRLVILKNGELVADDTPDQTLTPQRIEAVYGLPAIVQPHPERGHPVVIL